MALEEPTLIPRPWASAPNGRYEEIPDTTDTYGRASWSLGFPIDTATPLKAGGIPPNWLDMQGVLYALSNHIFFQQSGARYEWNDSLYFPAGACVIGSDGVVYQALQDSGPSSPKDPTDANNSAYWGPLATPDGNTIRMVNGKLSVHPGTLSTMLADGTTIVANNSKLSVQPSGIADGETIVVENGKLKAVGGGGGGTTIDVNDLVDEVTTVVDSNDKIKAIDVLTEGFGDEISLVENVVYSFGNQEIDGDKTFLEHVLTTSVSRMVSVVSNGVVDLSVGSAFTLTPTKNTNLVIESVPNHSTSFSLLITNGGNYTITWPTNVIWPLSTAPTLTQSGSDLILMFTPNEGVDWYGYAITGYGASGGSAPTPEPGEDIGDETFYDFRFVLDIPSSTGGHSMPCLPFITSSSSGDTTKVLSVNWGDGTTLYYSLKQLSTQLSHSIPSGVTVTCSAKGKHWRKLLWKNWDAFCVYVTNILDPLPPLNGSKCARPGTGHNYSSGNSMLSGCTHLTSVCAELFKNISISSVSYAFSHCNALRVLPENVFSGCKYVSNMARTFYGSGISTAYRQWFTDCGRSVNYEGCLDVDDSTISVPSDLLWDIGIKNGDFVFDNVNLSEFFKSWRPTTNQTLWIRNPNISSATTMFYSTNSGGGTVTIYVPAGSTTETTLRARVPSWVTVTAIADIENDPNAPT